MLWNPPTDSDENEDGEEVALVCEACGLEQTIRVTSPGMFADCDCGGGRMSRKKVKDPMGRP